MTVSDLSALDSQDTAYVKGRFMPLGLLARANGWDVDALRLEMAGGRVPKVSYILPDGTEMIPTDYFALVGDGSELDTLRDRFIRRYEVAVARLGLSSADESAATWESYLSGGFAACLKSVTPESIALKGALVDAITALVSDPKVDDAAWSAALCAAVSQLDDLEMPFARWDDIRFGSRSSRARLIDDVRAQYPGVFAD